MNVVRACSAWLLAAAILPSHAQIRLPSLSLPTPQISSLSPALDPVQAVALTDVRRIAARTLLRDNRRTIEADPAGEPVVRGEILALMSSEQSLAGARRLGFAVDRQQSLAELQLTVLRAPGNLTTRQALRVLRDADPAGTYDYNHIYVSAGGLGAASAESPAGEPAAAGPRSLAPVRVGLLDEGVDASHPAFGATLMDLHGCGDKSVPRLHGTAVASLLVAHAAVHLYAADVYCGAPTGGAVDAIVAALGWMEQQHVPVINVSLVGPKNLMLQRAVEALSAHGQLIVAAVGNDGPAAPPLYPAAYPGVVGVTGVDAHRRVLIEAERGPQVMFAAPGVDIKAANLQHGWSTVRGTSFAAPTVAALLAALLPAPAPDAAREAIAALAAQAESPGRSGRDLTYGYGFVGSTEESARAGRMTR